MMSLSKILAMTLTFIIVPSAAIAKDQNLICNGQGIAPGIPIRLQVGTTVTTTPTTQKITKPVRLKIEGDKILVELPRSMVPLISNTTDG